MDGIFRHSLLVVSRSLTQVKTIEGDPLHAEKIAHAGFGCILVDWGRSNDPGSRFAVPAVLTLQFPTEIIMPN